MSLKIQLPAFPAGETGIETFVLADYAELRCLLTKTPLPLSQIESSLRGSNYRGIDNALVDVRRELSRRARLLGGESPYKFFDDALVPGKVPNVEFYLFFAALSMGENISNPDRKVFEDVITELVKAKFGLKALSIGFPRRDPVPQKVQDAFTAYCSYIGENFQPAHLTPYAKDKGLDIVGWYSFPDRRGSYLHMIGQCATGADWKEKLFDLYLPTLRRVIDYSTDPLRFVATPFFAPDAGTTYKELSIKAGLLLDRPRLWHLVRTISVPHELSQTVLKTLRALY